MAEQDDGEFSRAERQALDAWTAPKAPVDFAARVMQRVSPAAPAIRPSPRPRTMWAAAVAAVLVVGLFAKGPVQLPSSGDARPTSRLAIDVGRRAMAVVEPGAELAWHVSLLGDAEVEQRRGNIFYRVEPGGR